MDFIELERAMLHVEVAINEAGHKRVPFRMDYTGRSPHPLLYPMSIANIDDVFTPNSNRLCVGFFVIGCEDMCISEDDISIGEHMQSPDIYSCGMKYCSTIRLKGW
jgi:hypothetical protein